VHYALEAMRETLASGALSCEVRAEAHDEYADRYQDEIGQLVWSHPAITHSHYKNSEGKVFTLSPWPLDQYWEWTRHIDRAHYRFDDGGTPGARSGRDDGGERGAVAAPA